MACDRQATRRAPHPWVRFLCLLTLIALPLSAAAAEAQLKLDVLRAESYGDVLDVLLRVEAPGERPEELGPDHFAVYIAPADRPLAEATTPRYRVRRLFLKRLGSAYYTDLRQLPAGVGDTPCQLVLQLRRRGQQVVTHRLPALIEPPAEELDVALVIDESLSMRRTDPEGLRVEAAKTFVQLARRSSRIRRIAIVAFNNKARTLVSLTAPAEADILNAAIGRIRAFGQTDMDGALKEALAAFKRSTTRAKAVVLLTDGKDEPGRYENTHRLLGQQRWPVYTVGLSRRADANVLQRIARETGGEYHEAPTNAQLQDIFGRICLILQKKVLIRSRALSLPPGQTTEDPFHVDDTISAMTVSLRARRPEIGFALRSPAGRALTPDLSKTERGVSYGRKGGYQYYDLSSPPPGRWTARLEAPRPAQVAVSATAVTPLLLRAFPLKATYYRGEPIEIAASLAYGDSILADARVEARIATSDGASATAPLYDDGRHHDTGPEDGVFAGLFPGSEQPGTCTIRLLAAGTTPAGYRFEREINLTTTISEEGYSKLWCSRQLLDFGLLYNGESASRTLDLKLTTAIPTTAAEAVRTAIQPPSTATAQRLPPDVVRLTPSPLRLDTARLSSVALALTVPPNQPPGRYHGQLDLASKYDKLSLPIQLEVRRPKLVLDKRQLDLGALESGSRAHATIALRLDPRGSLPARLVASDARLSVAPKALQLGPKAGTARLSLAPAADEPTGSLQAALVVETPLGKTELPVAARIVKPSLAVSPARLDFGEIRPGDAVSRRLTLRLEGLQPRQASFAAAPLAGPANTPSLNLTPTKAAKLTPGEVAAVQVNLRVPPVQPPGAYRGQLTVGTALGKKTVTCTARVAPAETFQVAGTLDFERVAIGSTKELAVEVASLVDAEQKVALSLPQAAPDWQLAAEATSLALPPRGKARITFRLTSSAAAKPGPRQATVAFRGPSRGVALDARALLFRPPHASLAFEPAELDLGRLQAGVTEQEVVRVRSLVDEAQKAVIERIEAPGDAIAIEAEPRTWALAASGSQSLTLALRPIPGADEIPFEATVVARGRSLPATLRLRGRVFTPPGTTFALEERSLDFGTVPQGGRATLPLTVQSLFHREQKVSFASAPSTRGVSLDYEVGGFHLLPGVARAVAIELRVAQDASLGERQLTCEVRGPGEPATFEARVEVVAPPPPVVAAREPGRIGWAEGVLLFLLLLLLLAALVGAFLLARWLIRTQRMPRMAKYFAVSALIHAAALFTALDLFIAREVQKKGLGPLFRVGLKALAGGALSSQRPSVADQIRARRERERRIQAARRQREAARAARSRLAAPPRRLRPTEAELRRPKPQEKPRLTHKSPKTKKISIKDLGDILEKVPEAERIRQARKLLSQEAVETQAAHQARIRSMTREQLEAAVRKTLKPKAAKPEKPAAAPAAPGLARRRRAEKTTLQLKELVLAMEGFKRELVEAGKPSGKPGALTPQRVGAGRAEQRAAIERRTGLGKRVGAAEARAAPAAGRPGAPSPRIAIGLQPSGKASAERKVAAPSFATPEEPAPAIEVGEHETAQAAGQRGALTSREVGAAKAGRGAAVERRTGPGERAGAAEARAAATPGRTAAGRAAVTEFVGFPEAPAARRRAAAPSFALPDEAPAADEFVELPAGPESAKAEVEAMPVPVRRQPAGRGSGPARRAMRPALPWAPAAGALGAGEAPLSRAGARTSLPTTARAAAAEKATPSLDEIALVEGPLVAPRHRAAGERVRLGPQTVVARWRARRRPGGGEHLAMREAGASSQLAPRTAVAGRAITGAPIGSVESPGAERLEAPDLAELPPEEVEAGPGVAEARQVGEAASGVSLSRAGAKAQIERAGSLAAPARQTLGPRSVAAARRRISEPSPLGRVSEGEGRRQDFALPEPLPDESAESTPQAAARRAGTQPTERDLTPPERAAGLAEPQIERAASLAAPTRQTLGPRSVAAAQRRISEPSPLGRVSEGEGRRQDFALPEPLPDESAESRPQAAARRTGTRPTERDLTPPERAGRPAEPRREARPTRRRVLEPRLARLARTQGRATPRLLLPGLARRPRGAGALFGALTGGVKSFVLTTIKYGSGEVDWDTHKTMMPFLAWQLRERIGFSIATKIQEVPLESGNILRSPWLFMSGHRNFRFTDAQVANLRRYLLGGGTLWADDSTHEDDYTWDRAFRREIARVLSPPEGYRLRRITRGDDHPLFRSCFDLSEGYAGYFPPPGDKYRQNYIEGIEINGRLVVIYTRNDYGDGLEIQPDTFPLKVSLSGLSPAEMQESSFLMSCNIIVYILTRGRGLADHGLVARAADSLRRHQEARGAQRDPYANAPATLFDDFSAERWQAQGEWEGAGSATLGYARRADPRAEGRRLAVRFQLGRGRSKIVLVREVPEELDLTGQGRCYVEIDSRLSSGARLSVALITMPNWAYFESRPAFIKPGRNRVHFELNTSTWKTGEPVPEGQPEFCRRPANLDAVRRFVVLLYPIQPQGTVVFDRIEFRGKP